MVNKGISNQEEKSPLFLPWEEKKFVGKRAVTKSALEPGKWPSATEEKFNGDSRTR